MILVNRKMCVGCGRCQTFCPEEALKAWGYLKIDDGKCTECLLCLDECPMDALTANT